MFLLIIIAASILRVYLIVRDSIPFAYDMGRDLLWAKDIAFYHIPTLIGPAASIWGVYFGPLWFYYLAVPLVISSGHPLSAVYATTATIIATGILAFFLLKKYLGSFHSLVLSILVLFNSTLINISTFAFHANLLPLLTLLMNYFCYVAVVKKPVYIAGAFLSVSLMFHADPAPAVVNTFMPIAIAVIFKFYKSKNFKKTLILSAVAFTTPFIPQMLFELRNGFIQTKSLLAYFLGQNPSLSGQLPFLERVTNRLDLFFNFFKQSFSPQSNLLAAMLLLLTAIGVYSFFRNVKDKNLKILAKINLYSLILTFFMLTFLVTVEVKDWYLYGLPVIFASLITFSLITIRYKIISVIFLILFILINVGPFLAIDRNESSKKDPALLDNQLSAIITIYEDAKKESFSVYIFTPPIYDYSWQYLFWWHGVKLNKGLPQDFAYLPDQPAYVRNKEFYASNATKSDLVYLIIENAPENQFYTKENWLKNFEDFELVWEKDIKNALVVQKRQR